MPTVNQRLYEEDISHQVDQQRYANYLVFLIIGLLNESDDRLFAQLFAALEDLPAESFTVRRLEGLLSGIRDLNAEVYQQAEEALSAELQKFVEYEADYLAQLFNAVVPAEILAQTPVAEVKSERAFAAVLALPFLGKILKGFTDDDGKYVPSVFEELEASRITRLRDAIRDGYVANQTVAEILQGLRGTKSAGYSDGVMDTDRRHAETVVRAAVGHAAAVTRNQFQEQNEPLIKALVWRSVLDNKTSEGCRLRDSKQYTADGKYRPIGHKIPWLAGPGALHWGCRAVSVPVLRAAADLDGIDVESLSPSTRASMDGQVPAEITYGDWLRRQSAKRQDDILGPTRGKLFREGGLDLDRFYNEKGKYLTLEELRQRDAEAFKRAGL